MLILGIETSCDETAAAVVEKTAAGFAVRSNVVASQVKIHARYGGVVPEVAARNHVAKIIPVIDTALRKAKISRKEIDRIAVTAGPGLITSLLVGVQAAKTLSFVWEKPIVPVNHLRAHVYAAWLPSLNSPSPGPLGGTTLSHAGERENRVAGQRQLPSPRRGGGIKGEGEETQPIRFPIVALVVSGGHTELVLMKNARSFKLLGATLDDAAGEAFDKVAKMLGFPYPGGPALAKLAERGNPAAIPFPRPMEKSGDLNFSFSGLKTAVLYTIYNLKPITYKLKADVAASFQQAVVDSLISKTLAAVQQYHPKTVVLGGGVAANKKLREQLSSAVESLGILFRMPDQSFCTDNAAMVAVAGYFGNSVSWKKIRVDANLSITK